MTLGNAIKLVRTAGRLKQRALAKKLNVSENYLSLIENGKREPSLSFLRGIAKALDVPVGIFFLWQDFDTEKRTDGKSIDQIRDLLARLEAMYVLNRSRRSGTRKRVA